MSKKSLGGAKYFEALGRRSIGSDIVGWVSFSRRNKWPKWAFDAYQRGRWNQTDCIPKGVITKDQYFNDPIV